MVIDLRAKRIDIEKIIERVNGSMAMEGMPLTGEDKARIRRYGGDKAMLRVIKKELIEKHSDSKDV